MAGNSLVGHPGHVNPAEHVEAAGVTTRLRTQPHARSPSVPVFPLVSQPRGRRAGGQHPRHPGIDTPGPRRSRGPLTPRPRAPARHLHADKAYDSAQLRSWLAERRITARIARRGIDSTDKAQAGDSTHPGLAHPILQTPPPSRPHQPLLRTLNGYEATSYTK